ncbi:MAG: sensor histidine kinase, partial [Bacteroidota bacterium]
IRYGEELLIEYEVRGDTHKKKIPPLILISFVENSFKHGLSGAVENSWIKIKAKVNEGQFLFTVENSLPEAGTISDQEKSRVKSGIGLENVRKRLNLIYGKGYDLTIAHKTTYLIELVIYYT